MTSDKSAESAEMLKKPSWLEDLYGLVRCPICGHSFRATEMSVEKEVAPAPPAWPAPSYWIHCECTRCGVKGHTRVDSVIIDTLVEHRVPALTAEDVLDCHDALAAVDRLPEGWK